MNKSGAFRPREIAYYHILCNESVTFNMEGGLPVCVCLRACLCVFVLRAGREWRDLWVRECVLCKCVCVCVPVSSDVCVCVCVILMVIFKPVRVVCVDTYVCMSVYVHVCMRVRTSCADGTV